MRRLIFIIFVTVSAILNAQKQNDNWFFGKYIGVQFNNTAPNGFNFISGGQMETLAGCATISDKNTGDLLFYTNGRTIWNKNHLIMENGNDLRGAPSAAQPAIIVPKPGSTSIYYVFTMSGISQYQGQTEKKGLAYSIIDISLNGGLGKVINKNNILFSNAETEMLTSTLGHDGTYYWVLTQKDSDFLAYKVDVSGVETTPISSSALFPATGDAAKRGIRISPNSQHIAVRDDYDGLFAYTFNNQTGSVSNGVQVSNFNKGDPYGVSKNGLSFSPDSNVIYLSVYEELFCCPPRTKIYKFIKTTNGWQFLNSNTPPNMEGIISLQLASNNKILVSVKKGPHVTDRNYLVWIEDPNSTNDYFQLSSEINPPNTLSIGFPQLINLNTAPVCLTNLTITTPITSSQDFQVSNLITASSVINPNLNVNFKANEILLDVGFEVSGIPRGNFSAIIDPCSASKNKTGDEYSDYFTHIEKEESLNKPVLYPNPTNGSITIDNVKEIQEWKVLNMYGRIIASGNNTGSGNKILLNLGNASTGLYYFNAILKNGELFQKTIIKN